MGKLTLFSLFFLFLMATTAYAEPPQLPAFFAGSITVDGNPAQIGTTITAKIEGQIKGTTTTTESGQYGSNNQKLMVQGTSADTAKTITFYINGKVSDTTAIWNSGAVYENKNIVYTTPKTTTSSSGGSSSSTPPPIVEEEENETEPVILPTKQTYENGIITEIGTSKQVTIKNIDGLPEGLTSPVGIPYQYFSMDSEETESVRLIFKVEKSWIAANLIEVASIRLDAYDGTSWSKIQTTKLSHDDEYIYFSAMTYVNSKFVSIGSEIKKSTKTCIEERTIAYNPNNTQECIEYPSDCEVPEGWIIADECYIEPIKAPTGFILAENSTLVGALVILLMILGAIIYKRK